MPIAALELAIRQAKAPASRLKKTVQLKGKQGAGNENGESEC